MTRSKIVDCSYYVPTNIVTNADIAKFIDTSDEWIESRTGIKQRHIAPADISSFDMATRAIENLFESKNLKIKKEDVELLVVATTTPDNTLPSLACKIQRYIKPTKHIPAFDINAACGGFVYGLQIVDSLIKTGKYKNALLVTSDKMSSLLDFKDRSTCPLFGDAAGAVLFEASSDLSSGIIDTCIMSDGDKYDLLYTDGGVSRTASSGKIRMLGKEVFIQAVKKMSSSCMNILDSNLITVKDIKYFIPHQTNSRMIEIIAEKLNIDECKVVNIVKNFANCSSSAIPIAMSTIKNNLKSGDILLITTIGAGITYGSSIVRW